MKVSAKARKPSKVSIFFFVLRWLKIIPVPLPIIRPNIIPIQTLRSKVSQNQLEKLKAAQLPALATNTAK